MTIATTTLEVFDAIDERFSNIPSGVLKKTEFSPDEYRYLANKLLSIVDNMFPTPCDRMKQGNQVVFKIHDVTSKSGDENKRILGIALDNMHKLREDNTVPAVLEHNDCEIVINTVCGEKRTISMTQEITNIEYGGRTLRKTGAGEFLV